MPAGISLTQNQYGPVGVGGKLRPNPHGRVPFGRGKGLGQSFQTGNTNDQYLIDQTSTQDTNEGTGSNQQNFGRADCTTTGSCTAGQLVTVNGSDTGDGYTSPVITNLVINCPTGSSCQATPPPVPTITSPAPPTTESRMSHSHSMTPPPRPGSRSSAASLAPAAPAGSSRASRVRLSPASALVPTCSGQGG